MSCLVCEYIFRYLLGAVYGHINRTATQDIKTEPAHKPNSNGKIPLTKQEQETIIKLRAEGKGNSAIGKAISRSPSTVNSYVRAHHLKLGSPQQAEPEPEKQIKKRHWLTLDEKKAIRKLREQGYGVTKIAEAVFVKPKSVTNFIRKFNIQPKPRYEPIDLNKVPSAFETARELFGDKKTEPVPTYGMGILEGGPRSGSGELQRAPDSSRALELQNDPLTPPLEKGSSGGAWEHMKAVAAQELAKLNPHQEATQRVIELVRLFNKGILTGAEFKKLTEGI